MPLLPSGCSGLLLRSVCPKVSVRGSSSTERSSHRAAGHALAVVGNAGPAWDVSHDGARGTGRGAKGGKPLTTGVGLSHWQPSRSPRGPCWMTLRAKQLARRQPWACRSENLHPYSSTMCPYLRCSDPSSHLVGYSACIP